MLKKDAKQIAKFCDEIGIKASSKLVISSLGSSGSVRLRINYYSDKLLGKMNRMGEMKLILSFMLFALFVGPTFSQSNLQERNFEVLQIYRDRVESTLSPQCVWYLAPLFGSVEVFPSLPNIYEITNLEFVNADLDHPFFDQNRLAPYIHNLDASYQITTALNQCRSYGDDDSRVFVFLFNLLRNYVAIVARPPGLIEGKTAEKSCTFCSCGSTVLNFLLVQKTWTAVLELSLRALNFWKAT